MSAVLGRRDEIITELRAAGVRVLDSPVPTAPCATLLLPSIRPAGNIGASLEVSWHLTLFTAPTSTGVGWAQLETMRAAVWRLYGTTITAADPGLRRSRKQDYLIYELQWQEILAADC